MEERIYIEPEMEVTLFDASDVITTSGGVVLPEDEWTF